MDFRYRNTDDNLYSMVGLEHSGRGQQSSNPENDRTKLHRYEERMETGRYNLVQPEKWDVSDSGRIREDESGSAEASTIKSLNIPPL